MSDRSAGNPRVKAGVARVFYGLVAASVAIPLLMFAADGYLTWRSIVQTATANLQGNAINVAEHATRLLDSHMMTAARVNDLARDLDDQQITADEAALHDRLMAITRHFSQVADITVVGADGHPLVSAQRYPVDRSLDFGNRHFFRILRDHIQSVVIGAPTFETGSGSSGLVVAVRRGRLGSGFQGVIVVKGAPGYLEMFDRFVISNSTGGVAGLYREDGVDLARYPRLATDAAPELLLRGIASDPASGVIRGSDTPDGKDRLLAYRRLDSYPVYATECRRWDAIVAEWRSTMAIHLIFGIPAILGLVTLSLLAARRAKRESAALADLHMEVERREAAEAALRHSQKLEAVGQLTGGIAHDFNNHLTVISSNIQMLRRQLADGHEGLGRLADAAMLGVRRAAALTHRLLAFSRQQPLDPEPLDIGRLVAGMTEMLRRTLREDIAIETRSASGLWQARVDAAQFENAVVHLALNASDAMPGGGTLRIHADNVTLDNAQRASHGNVPAGDYVRMTITDTGRGMAPETVTKAFEPFFTTKPRGEGSGLGLSTVHGFISQSGGHVEIASAAGRGTTITLLLPRHISQAAPSRTARSGKPASPGHETILVVEDDEAVRRVAVGMLREVGYDVLEAPDAMEAFRLIADRGGIDLLFTDVGLPGGVNGRALADAARNVSTTMKVLFTTGYAGRADSGDDGQTGDVHFLAKPFDFRQLVSKVRAVLDDAPELCEPAVLAEQERA